MNRVDAFQLMKEYTTNPSLQKHMLAVEAAMRAYARKLGDSGAGEEDSVMRVNLAEGRGAVNDQTCR